MFSSLHNTWNKFWLNNLSDHGIGITVVIVRCWRNALSALENGHSGITWDILHDSLVRYYHTIVKVGMLNSDIACNLLIYVIRPVVLPNRTALVSIGMSSSHLMAALSRNYCHILRWRLVGRLCDNEIAKDAMKRNADDGKFRTCAKEPEHEILFLRDLPLEFVREKQGTDAKTWGKEKASVKYEKHQQLGRRTGAKKHWGWCIPLGENKFE